MRTPVKYSLGVFAAAAVVYASFGAVGCTVTTTDTVDSGVPNDTGTPPGDTGTDTGGEASPDAPAGFAVIIPAKGLTTSSTDATEIHDFGGGATKADIKDGNRIAYAVGKSGAIESTNIGKTATDTLVDGRMVGLPVGTEATITVTGYLRGLNGKGTAPANMRIPWSVTTCKATPSATQDVTATCNGPLHLLDKEIDGVVFTADVLPSGYCDSDKAKSTANGFDALRARTPESGTAVASYYGSDCKGVVFIPAAEFAAAETAGISMWRPALETKGSGPACTLATPCKVDHDGFVHLLNKRETIGSERALELFS